MLKSINPSLLWLLVILLLFGILYITQIKWVLRKFPTASWVGVAAGLLLGVVITINGFITFMHKDYISGVIVIITGVPLIKECFDELRGTSSVPKRWHWVHPTEPEKKKKA